MSFWDNFMSKSRIAKGTEIINNIAFASSIVIFAV